MSHLTLLTLAALSLSASASLSSSLSSSHSSWQAASHIKGASAECAWYSYPPVAALAADYPAPGAIADLSHAGVLASDKAIFEGMNASIPMIAPKGTPEGDYSAVKYDTHADPDCWWTSTTCTTPKLASLEADVSSCPEPKTWGFTLDDGPNCSHNAYYDFLQSIDQKATLFYIGTNVINQPLEAQRGLADGHEICGHTWSHKYMTSLSNEQAFAELYYTQKIIKQVMGVTVTCWRPPSGDIDDRIRYIANALGMRTILWKHDTFDWNYATLGVPAIEQNYEAIINASYETEGIIVLTHEVDAETMALSQQFLPQIQNTFTGGVMPVGACQNISEPYGEGAAYQYPNYAQYVAGTRSIALAAPTAAGTAAALASGSAVTSAGLAPTSAISSGSIKGNSSSSIKSSAKGARSTSDSSTTSTSSAGLGARLSGGALVAVVGAVGAAAFAVALV